jgi:putative pre-16S rRNA nuclease
VDNTLRLLGLDVGDRRIGVAVSDPTGSLATPVTVYHRRDLSRDVQSMLALMHEYEASGFVVGLPRNMNGSEGPQAEKTREFAAALSSAGATITLWDERLSTIEANRRITEVRPRGRKKKQHVDDEAAAVILETYLEHLRIGRPG